MFVLTSMFWIYRYCRTLPVLKNTCKPDMRCALVAKCACTRVQKRALGTKNTRYHTLCEYFQSVMLCLPELFFSLDFIYLRYFSTLFNKKSRTFKNQKRNSSTLMALKFGILKFKDFKFSRRVRTL